MDGKCRGGWKLVTVNGLGDGCCCCENRLACCPLGPGPPPCSRSLRLSWNALCSAIRAAIVSGELVGYETTGGDGGGGLAVLVACTIGNGFFVLVVVLATVVDVVVRTVVLVVVVVDVVAAVDAKAAGRVGTVVTSSSK